MTIPVFWAVVDSSAYKLESPHPTRDGIQTKRPLHLLRVFRLSGQQATLHYVNKETSAVFS